MATAGHLLDRFPDWLDAELEYVGTCTICGADSRHPITDDIVMMVHCGDGIKMAAFVYGLSPELVRRIADEL